MNSELRIKRNAFFALLLFAINCPAQNFGDSVLTALKKKSLNELKTLLESSNKHGQRMVLDRQLLGDYFEYSYELPEEKGEEIKLLCNGNKVIYSKVTSSGKKVYNSQDSAETKKFLSAYAHFFESKIKLTDLFCDTIQYGRGCGFVGIDPYQRKRLKKLIETKNTKELTKLLQSPVTEKQLYGVEGFLALEEKGTKLTPLQKKLVEFIQTKKGNAKTCNGCIYGDKEISSVFAKR